MIAPETSLREAIEGSQTCQRFQGREIEYWLVTDHNQLIGVLTGRELFQYILTHSSDLTVPVSRVMTVPVFTLKVQELNATIALDLLDHHKITCCPVLDDQDHPIGVITYRSLCQMLRTATQVQDWVHETEDLTQCSPLQTNNTLLVTAVEHAGDGIEIINHQGVLEYVNPALEEMTGYTRLEMLGKTPEELFGTAKQNQATHQAMVEMVQQKQIWSGRLLARRKDGSLCHQEVTVSPVCDGSGEITHCVAVRRDVTERKRIEEALRLTQFAVDRAADAVFWTRRDGRLIYVNRAACALLGYSVAEFLMMSIQNIDPSFSSDRWEYYWQEIQQAGAMTFEAFYGTREGQELPVEVTTNYLEFNGQVYHLAFVRDISERKQAEAQLKASLAEKDLLLKEVHHRVKNNLQVISSIFSLQSNSIADPAMLSVFSDSRNRIQSMALIHEKLYQTPSLASIDFADYVKTLVRGLLSTQPRLHDRISLAFNITEICLGVDVAIPCGLLVNELVSNTLKHAFPDDRPGEITIDFASLADQHLCLTVRDNGVGLPTNLIVDR
ncbi:MAG: PAS domain S-box protein, partial [Leptolyngbyaceae cyanobacterium bins.59]|nr:PAS domain S-box protein [Leptolyngbyaceae cyanobacterium bins.59]